MEKLNGERRKCLSLGWKILTLHIVPLPCEHPLKSSVLVRSVPFRSRVNGASNSELKPDLSNRVKFEIIELTAAPQQQYKQGTILYDSFYMLFETINQEFRAQGRKHQVFPNFGIHSCEEGVLKATNFRACTRSFCSVI